MRFPPSIATPRRAAIGLVLLAAVAVLAACVSLPSNFDTLPLDQQIAAYDRHCSTGMFGSMLSGPDIDARAQEAIAKHGVPAAMAMLPYIRGEKKGIPPEEALRIVTRVEQLTWALKDTEVEKAVRTYIDGKRGSDFQVSVAQITLDAIATQKDTARKVPAAAAN